MKTIVILKREELEKLEEKTKILHQDFNVDLDKYNIKKGEYFGGYSHYLNKYVIFKALSARVYILYSIYNSTTKEEFLKKCKQEFTIKKEETK